MDSPFIVPLACFAMVVLIVAITHVAKIRDKELEIQQRMWQEQREHQRKIKELDLELERVKQGT